MPPSRTALCLFVLSPFVIGFAQSLPVSLIVSHGPTEHPLYLKVRLSDGFKISRLHPSDAIEGVLSRSVYSGDRELFPAGSHVGLVVSRLKRRRRAPNDHWPWVIQLFAPRYEQYPTFQFGNVLLPSGAEVPLNVSVLTMARSKEIQAGAESPRTDRAGGLTVAVEATESSPEPDLARTIVKMPINLAAGTQAKIVLLGDLSASKSRPGDTFQARLVEPVRVGPVVELPEGALFEGAVKGNIPPRWLSRAGSLLITFTSLTLPGSSDVHPVLASVAGAEIDRSSHRRIDPEGQMRGERPGKLWMIVNAGVAGGIAKEADDGTQLVVEALISTATDVSTAGVARIVGLCASSVFILKRHGRDVVLPKFTEMEITFDRPVSLVDPESASSRPKSSQ